METDEGYEKVLLKEKEVLIKGEKPEDYLGFFDFKICDDYFIYVEDNLVVQTYDFNRNLLMEKELIDWETSQESWISDHRVSYYDGKIWNTALMNEDELLVQTIDIK